MAQNDTIDLTEKNIIGAIDRFATNIALAGLAIIPSCLIVIFMPWRLTPMIVNDKPDGRTGPLLAPGIFFPLTVISSIVLIANIVPELAPAAIDASANAEAAVPSGTRRATFIGGDDIRQMAAAWRAGDINQILLVFLPVFAVCVITFAATSWIQIIVGRWWTMRTAVRSGFYIFGALIGSVSAVALMTSQMEVSDSPGALILALGLMAFFPWCYMGILKAGGVEGKWQLISAAMLASLTMLFVNAVTILVFF